MYIPERLPFSGVISRRGRWGRNSCRCRRPRVRCLSAWAFWTPSGIPGWISCRWPGWRSCSCSPATWSVWTSGRRASSPFPACCRWRPVCCTWKTAPNKTGTRLKHPEKSDAVHYSCRPACIHIVINGFQSTRAVSILYVLLRWRLLLGEGVPYKHNRQSQRPNTCRFPIRNV